MSRHSERISDFELMKERLVGTDLYANLEKVLFQFMRNEQASDRRLTQASKETLKVVISGLVEEVWRAVDAKPVKQRAPKQSKNLSVKAASQANFSFTITEPQQYSRVHETSNKVLNSSDDFKPYSKRQRSPRLDNSLDTLSKSLFTRSPQEALSMSDFCRIKGAGTFGKAQRKLNEETKSSPGPSSYKFDTLKLRRKSPRTVIPTATVKPSYEKPFTTPGPSAYYPISSSRSRR